MPDPAVLWTLTAEPVATPWPIRDGIPTIDVDLRAGGQAFPAVHPGVLDAEGGFVAHRVVLSFTVAEAHDCVLRLDFAAERGPCPDLEVVVDDAHHGVFHPHVDRVDRSATGEPGPVAGPACLEIPLPGEWLGAGEHSISITTVLDEAAALGEHSGATHDLLKAPGEALPPARSHYGNWFGAYIRWRSATLVHARPQPGVTSGAAVALRATPFYVRSGDEDVELVDCDVSWTAGAPRPGRTTLSWNGESADVPAFPAGRDFGTFRWRFPAVGLTGPSTVRITGDQGDHEQLLVPCRRWQLHLIPHVHLDLGFTDTQGAVLELHCRNIDRALDLMDTDPRFRFAVDGSVVVQEYEKTRPPAAVRRMRAAISAGRLGVNTFHSNALTGLVSLDEMYHSTDFALTLPRSETTSFRYANVTDVPTYSRSIPSVLSDLGVDGFVGMSNHGRAATDASDALHLASPVRWRGPDGSELLSHFADHYSQLRFIAGDPQSLVGAANGLDRYVSRFDRPDYLPRDLAVIGTHADNEDIADGDTGFVDRWNEVFAWPRLRISTFDEYLSAVAPLRADLPLWESESGSFWEDGIGSAAADFATYRRTQPVLTAAATLGALVSAASGTTRTNVTAFARAWESLSIASEHTLTWARSTSHPHASPVGDQLAWKRRHITDAHRTAIDEMRRHLAQLAELVDVSGPGLLVYNPHAWTADLEAETDLAEGVDLIGATGPVPVETLTSCAGMRRVRLRLADMPAHSWRFLPMSAGLRTLPGGEGAPRDEGGLQDGIAAFAMPPSAERLETAAWLVEFDPDTTLPRRIQHRHSGRELLDPDSALRLGQIVRTGATPFSAADADGLRRPADVHSHRRRRTLAIENFRYVPDPPASELVQESPAVEFVGSRTTFDGVRLRWLGGGAGIDNVVVDLLLRGDSATCDLDVRFDKQPCLDMEAVYVAFPFGGTDPVVRYDRPLGWVEPAADHGPGASNEWGAVTNAVSIDSAQGSIVWTPLDAPLFTVGDVVRGAWPTTFPRGCGQVLSYAMNNYWPCNTPPVQSGPLTLSYRFSLADGFDAVTASRAGRTARLGAQASEVLPLARYRPAAAPEYREGLLIGPDGGDALDAQVAEVGADGTMLLRLTNLGPTDRSMTLVFPGAGETDGPAGERARAEVRGFGVHHVLVPGTGGTVPRPM